MIVEFKGKEIEFDEIGDTLDVLDCYDSDVEVFGTDENGVSVSSGVYIYTLSNSGSYVSKRMLLVK